MTYKKYSSKHVAEAVMDDIEKGEWRGNSRAELNIIKGEWSGTYLEEEEKRLLDKLYTDY